MAKTSLPRRLLRWFSRVLLIFVAGSILLVLIYRFVPPPITITMIANAGGGRGITKDWMALDRMDPDMCRDRRRRR